MQNLTAPNNGSIQILNTVRNMIIFVSVLPRDIVEQRHDFIWERPQCCPRCAHYKVWNHGFAERILDGFNIPRLTFYPTKLSATAERVHALGYL